MARRFRVRMRKNINIPRVVGKTTAVIVALYVGNEIINQIGTLVTNTSGPFNNGFKLIGWTVGNQITNGTTECWFTCSGGGTQSLANAVCNATAGYVSVARPSNCVTSTSGAGVLAVVGVVGIASIILEFVTFNMGR